MHKKKKRNPTRDDRVYPSRDSASYAQSPIRILPCIDAVMIRDPKPPFQAVFIGQEETLGRKTKGKNLNGRLRKPAPLAILERRGMEP